jgi:O-acetyl-ADP-ribose deacetylase (regulator of RNase III)
MIEVRVGNVLDVPTGIIVHGCNCFGSFGAGIALAIKNRYPVAYKVYRYVYETDGLKLGEICSAEVEPSKYIVNANTQRNTGAGRQISYDAIVKCFEEVNNLAKIIRAEQGTLDIVFPMIGAGLGGGNWNIIEKIIDETVSDDFKKILYKLN